MGCIVELKSSVHKNNDTIRGVARGDQIAPGDT